MRIPPHNMRMHCDISCTQTPRGCPHIQAKPRGARAPKNLEFSFFDQH